MRLVLFLLSIQLCLSSAIELYAAKIYEGTIIPISKTTLHSGTQMSFNGILEHVARVGSVIKPQITNDRGTVIKKGTQLTLLSTDYWAAQVMSAEYAVEAAKANLLTVSENYKRLEYLSETHSLSIEDYQSVRSNYYASLSLLHEAKGTLERMQQRLDACSIISPIEGIVDKVLFVKGEAALWPKTIIISQLNPIGVKVKMSRDESGKIVSVGGSDTTESSQLAQTDPSTPNPRKWFNYFFN